MFGVDSQCVLASSNTCAHSPRNDVTMSHIVPQPALDTTGLIAVYHDYTVGYSSSALNYWAAHTCRGLKVSL